MSGRLGMTGAAVRRGDVLVGKAMAAPVAEAAKKKVPLRLLKPTRTQYANWGLDAAVAGTGVEVLRRSRKHRDVTKRDGDHSRRNSVVGGTLAGAGATDLGLNVGGWVTRESIKHHERKVDAGVTPHPTTRNQRKKVLSAHRHAHGITNGSPENAHQSYYRKYPKGLPAWKTKRVMGYKNTPGIAGAALAAGTLAGTAYGARRKVNKAQGSKSALVHFANGTEQIDVRTRRGIKNKARYEEQLRGARDATKKGGRFIRTGTQFGVVGKVDTTMSEHRAHELARQYDTRGTLPKGLSRDQKMEAYEARYIAAGGKKSEKWKHRADSAEVGRNIGLAGATTSAAALLAARSKKVHGLARATPVVRRIKAGHVEGAGLASAAGGGASELYGEHARSRRASYQNSPAGVAGSALSRMRAYTPGAK
jgi:hypothetical protein